MRWIAVAAAAAIGCGSSVAPPPAEIAVRQPEPTRMPQGKRVKLQTDDGLFLEGTMWPGPERRNGTNRANGAIVLVHDIGSDRTEWAPFISELDDRFTVIAIDMRGHGKSTKTIDGQTTDWRTFDDGDWLKIPLDVKAAIQYLGVVEPDDTAIGLVGAALGSSAVLVYAAGDESVRAVAMLSPRLSYRGLDVAESIVRLGPRPVLLLAAEGDRASADATRRLAEMAVERKAKIYPGGGRGVRMDGPVVADTVAFLTQTPARTPPLAGSDTDATSK